MNKSLRRKRASRMAAVQTLYGEHFAPMELEDADEMADAILEKFCPSDAELKVGEKPERALLVSLLTTLADHEPMIRQTVEGAINRDWSMERLGPLLQAILFLGTAEMLAKADRDPRVIIDEYTSITTGFYDADETGFVHATLETIARTLGRWQDKANG